VVGSRLTLSANNTDRTTAPAKTRPRDETRPPGRTGSPGKTMCRRAARTSNTTRSRSATAAVIWSGWVSHRRVEASTSASSNVTVPVGRRTVMPRSLQFTGGVSARGSVSLMLASMRGRRSAKHQRMGVDTTPSRAYLRASADDLGSAGSDSRLSATRGDRRDR
jgi:hypothetical protein